MIKLIILMDTYQYIGVKSDIITITVSAYCFIGYRKLKIIVAVIQITFSTWLRITQTISNPRGLFK